MSQPLVDVYSYVLQLSRQYNIPMPTIIVNGIQLNQGETGVNGSGTIILESPNFNAKAYPAEYVYNEWLHHYQCMLTRRSGKLSERCGGGRVVGSGYFRVVG